jgi:hypothetical protein
MPSVLLHYFFLHHSFNILSFIYLEVIENPMWWYVDALWFNKVVKMWLMLLELNNLSYAQLGPNCLAFV